jgi:glycosyltransferase involved in cell wall biosynthesis
MKILRIICTLSPAAGGPIEGLRQSVHALNEMGHPNEIVTLDAPGSPWLNEIHVPTYALGPSLGKYRFTPRLLPWLKQNAAHYDAIIVHGIWQFQSFGTWLASRKNNFGYYVFVHGALDPWFKFEYPIKHLKKWLYWPWAEYQVLRDAREVLFTSEEEKRLAAQSFWLYRANEKVVHYGVASPPPDSINQQKAFLKAFPTLVGKRFLLFLGRIHHKKGCDLLLKAFASLACDYPDWTLVMAGPDTENLRPTLEQIAQTLGIAPRIIWTGLLTGDLKWGALRSADAFILPSHSENFGLAIAEALACGTPVLISDKINIWQEIENAQAGLVASDTLEGTTDLLKKWFNLPKEEQARMRANAIPCFEQNFEIQASAAHLIQILQKP